MIQEITMTEMAEGLPAPDNDMRVVMFFGPTCGPCQATMPNYELSAEYYTSKNAPIKFFRINAWEPEEQKTYCYETWKIAGVPHFKVFYKGDMILERVGGGDQQTMDKFIHDGIDEVYKRFGDKI